MRTRVMAVFATAFLATTDVLWSASQSSGARTPHNVVLVVLDDVGTDMIGAYEALDVARGRSPGFPASTPAIDQLLVAQGVTFSAAWTAPKCSPTRAQILTGLHSSRNGVGAIVRANPIAGGRNPGLFSEAILLPQVLRSAPTPYVSAAVGKWHLADIDQMQSDPGHPLGSPHGTWFDHFAGSRFNLESVLGPGSGPSAYWNWRKLYASVLPFATPCGGLGPPCEVDMLAPPTRNYATADTTEDALALIASLPEPWFLYVSYNAIHAPFHVPPSDLPSAPCLPGSSVSLACSLDRNNSAISRARCMMTALDEQIGRLACAADPANTTFILIGDNGSPPEAVAPPFNPLRSKGTIYEGGVRVPLIIRSPLVPPARRGAVETRLAHSTDLFPTVLELAGASPVAGLDGRSLTPYLVGGAGPLLRRVNYTEAFFPNFRPLANGTPPPPPYFCTVHNQAIRDERFKLIRRNRRDYSSPTGVAVIEEFYDLEQGGPLNTSVQPPAPTRDWFETNELLGSGAPLPRDAADAYARLAATLDALHPTLVR